MRKSRRNFEEGQAFKMEEQRAHICPGMLVDIVLKRDQPTGRLTRGHVKRILTRSASHPRGIKFMLVEGEQVGRVQRICGQPEKKETDR